MRTLILLSIPLAMLAAFGVGVTFWATLSQLRFLTYFRKRDRRPPALGVAGWLRFHYKTLVGAYQLLWWLFRGAFQAHQRRPPRTTGRPVLCIHGLFMNSTSVWGIRRRLEAAGRPTRGVFMGVPFPTPMRYLEPLTRVFEEMASRCASHGFDVVAHSLGGVMTREVLRHNPHLATAVRTIVTLGSPHQGTAALRLFRFGPIYRMLSRGSPYLSSLPTIAELAPDSPSVTLTSWHDLVVYPVECAQLAGSRSITLSGISHLGLLTDPDSLAAVEAALAESARLARAGAHS